VCGISFVLFSTCGAEKINALKKRCYILYASRKQVAERRTVQRLGAVNSAVNSAEIVGHSLVERSGQ